MDVPRPSDFICARQDLRFEVTFATEAYLRSDIEFRQPLAVMIRNISRSGCMVTGGAFVRGDGLLIGLPEIGHLDSFARWAQPHRAGFQFEKPIHADRFVHVLAAIGYRPRSPGERGHELARRFV